MLDNIGDRFVEKSRADDQKTCKNVPLFAALFTVPTSTVASIGTFVTDQITDPGTLLVLVLVAGIPLAFYVIRKLVGLIPKGK